MYLSRLMLDNFGRVISRNVFELKLGILRGFSRASLALFVLGRIVEFSKQISNLSASHGVFFVRILCFFVSALIPSVLLSFRFMHALICMLGMFGLLCFHGSLEKCAERTQEANKIGGDRQRKRTNEKREREREREREHRERRKRDVME